MGNWAKPAQLKREQPPIKTSPRRGSVLEKPVTEKPTALIHNQAQIYITDLFYFGKVLRQGWFGKVREAREIKTHQIFIVKTVDKKANICDVNEIRRQFDILKTCQHPNIIKVHKIFEDRKQIHIVKELYPGPDLGQQLAQGVIYSEEKSADIMRKLFIAVNHTHKQGISHKDISPINIFVKAEASEIWVKLDGFGITRKEYEHAENLGSPVYMSPGVLEGNSGPHSDVWSLGIVMFQMLTGNLPLLGDTQKEVLAQIQSGAIDRALAEADLSFASRKILEWMLTYSDADRISSSDVLKNIWFLNTVPLNKQPHHEVRYPTQTSSSNRSDRAGSTSSASSSRSQERHRKQRRQGRSRGGSSSSVSSNHSAERQRKQLNQGRDRAGSTSSASSSQSQERYRK